MRKGNSFTRGNVGGLITKVSGIYSVRKGINIILGIIEKDVLKSKNGILMDMKTGDIKWDGKPPYCVELVSKNKIEKRYINNNSNFCVIVLMDDKKTVVIDKNFENSMFTKLFLEKSGNNYLKPVYKNQSVAVWNKKLNE